MKLHKFTSLAGILLLIVLTFALGACGTSQNTGNSSRNSGPPIKTIHMLDHSKGWALTDQNILFTSDGGQNWKNITPSGSTYSRYALADFMDDKYAWVVSTPDLTANSVNVLRTSDGGQHWQVSTIPANGASLLDYPRFPTTQEGFLELQLASGAEAGSQTVGIFHTTDGGQNWTEVSDSEHPGGLPHGGIKTGIAFKDVHNGWATGQDASMTPWLYMTNDGGHTWKQQALPNLPGAIGTESTSVQYLTTPPVFFGDKGFLPVQVQGSLDGGTASKVRGFLIDKSTDGGATWVTNWKTNPASLTTFISNNIYIGSTQNAWATDQDGNVYATSDAGEHWSQLASMVGTISALDFVDTSNGWGISNNKLLHTTDGGRNWSEVGYHITT
jgi:photosystem II stability/assembly factor-like uncharacterized protein